MPTALIDAAAKMLADEGPAALTVRRLAQEVGTSTTAVYTHFGSMRELRRAIRREGFVRFGRFLDELPHHEDPSLELADLGIAYMRNAFANRDLYRAMFMETPLDEEDADTGWDTFERLVTCVQRCIDTGVFPVLDDARWGAVQFWTISHGAVTLALIGLISEDEALRVCAEGGFALYARFATA